MNWHWMTRRPYGRECRRTIGGLLRIKSRNGFQNFGYEPLTLNRKQGGGSTCGVKAGEMMGGPADRSKGYEADRAIKSLRGASRSIQRLFRESNEVSERSIDRLRGRSGDQEVMRLIGRSTGYEADRGINRLRGRSNDQQVMRPIEGS